MVNEQDLRFIIDRNGHIIQHFVALEELSELSKEITKWLRGKGDEDALFEELADVQVMINQMLIMHSISVEQLEIMENEKLQRTIDRILGGETDAD